MSIIDSFCAEIKLFCETFNSSEYFQVVRENTNISSDLVRTRQKQLENFLTECDIIKRIIICSLFWLIPLVLLGSGLDC